MIKSLTLPKGERLKASEVKKVFESGQRTYGKTLTLLRLKQEDVFENRVAVIARKKTFRKAVERNRIKRCLREVYRNNKSLFPKTYHYVFLQHGVPREATYLSLLEEIKKITEKLPS